MRLVRGDDDAVADLPAGDRLGQRDVRRRPSSAVAPSLTQVRLSGAPWKSMRPPQQTMAGHDSLVVPST